MATNEEYRINKDTSARKDTAQDSRRLARELDGFKVYIEHMKNAYERDLQNLATEHEQEIESLRAQHSKNKPADLDSHKQEIKSLEAQQSKDRQAVLDSRQQEIDRATSIAGTSSAYRVASLEKSVAELTIDKDTLQASYKESLADNKRSTDSATKEIGRLKDSITRIKAGHDKKTAEMQRKIDAHPNSKIELSLRSKGRRSRTFHWRYNMPLSFGVAELCGQIKVERRQLIFKRTAKDPMGLNVNKTLEELNIKDGDEIWYDKLN